MSAKPTMKLYESRSCMEQRGDTKSGGTGRRETRMNLRRPGLSPLAFESRESYNFKFPLTAIHPPSSTSSISSPSFRPCSVSSSRYREIVTPYKTVTLFYVNFQDANAPPEFAIQSTRRPKTASAMPILSKNKMDMR